jgi:hypothetical protein
MSVSTKMQLSKLLELAPWAPARPAFVVSHNSTAGGGVHWLLRKGLHRLIKRSNLCSHRLMLGTQSLDTGEFAFDRLLAGA